MIVSLGVEATRAAVERERTRLEAITPFLKHRFIWFDVNIFL